MTPTAKQQELIEAAFSGKYTFILFGGAVGGAKTVGLYLLFLLAQRIYPGIQIVFVRKDLATIERNSYATWNEIMSIFGKPAAIKEDRRGNNSNPHLLTHNGSRLSFFGENYEKDKELTRWSGLIPNWFFADEINELTYKAYLKMFERAGRYQLQNLKNEQPQPLIVATCNPSQGWVKEQIYDKYKAGTLPEGFLYIPSKITDNPHLPEAYVKNLKNLPKYEYEVYVNGNWDIQLKTGGEFYHAFELDKHVTTQGYNPRFPIHISFDNNVYPYIAISLWQVTENEAIQIHEITAKEPNNSARKAARLVTRYLNMIDYKDKIFLYGDQTSDNRNTIDENKKSFVQLFYDELTKEYSVSKKIPSSNPPVAVSGDFINAIYSDEYLGLSIKVNENCKESINDYTSTKQDMNGGVLKKRVTDAVTKISYEEHGHFCDNKRYLLTIVWKEQFRKYRRRFSSDENIYSTGSGSTNRRF